MPRWRIAAATARENPRWRIAAAPANGTYAPVAASIADRAPEPLTVQTVQLTVLGGLAADSWTARVVSGDAITDLTVTGSTLTFTAPAAIPGTHTVIGVTPTVGGTTGAERTFSVNALPQNEWWTDGATWRPTYPAIAL